MAPTHKTAVKLVGVVAVMGALAWASVPLYNWFCQVTGFGGATLRADVGSDVVLDKMIQIRFDANVDRDMPWVFKPVVRTMDIRIGETGLAFYEAYNPTDRVIAGTAAFNVAPFSAGGYFTKIDCFCFELQVLQPGETVQMPVSFYVEPSIIEDSEARNLPTITLSYTFYETELPLEQASLDLTPQNPLN